MKHYQAGGGVTSPEYSYIYCGFVPCGQKVKLKPRIPDHHYYRQAYVELPEKCVLKQNQKGNLKLF